MRFRGGLSRETQGGLSPKTRGGGLSRETRGGVESEDSEGGLSPKTRGGVAEGGVFLLSTNTLR